MKFIKWNRKKRFFSFKNVNRIISVAFTFDNEIVLEVNLKWESE